MANSEPNDVLYFKFKGDSDRGVRNVEYDDLVNWLNEQRGAGRDVRDLNRDGYYAVAVSAAKGSNGAPEEARAFTEAYLRSIPTVAQETITSQLPPTNTPPNP
jgi:hypothetical protein